MKKILLATAVAAAFLLETPLAAQAYHRPSAELTFRPGNKRSILELDLLGPLYQTSESMLFVDLRGKGDTKRGREANLGLVYRWIVKNAGVAGVYVFGDLLRTRRKNTFWQIVTGLEGLSVGGVWDMRVNAYFVDKKKHLIPGANSTTVTGSNINLFKNAEVAMSGFDGEVGVLIPGISTKDVEIRVFGGGYSFTRHGISRVAGPQGRLEVRFYDLINAGSRLTLGVEMSHDKVRGNTVFGCIGLRIPFQMSDEELPQGLQRRLADYVIRDVDIITQDSLPVPQGLLTNVNGQPVRIIHVQASAPNGGDGTIGAPFNDLNVGIKAATQSQDIIHIIHGDNYLQLTASGALLADKVTVAGDGADLYVTSQTGDVYPVFAGSSAKRSKVISPTASNTTAFDFSAQSSTGGFSGTVQGVSITVPSYTNANAVNATYTAPEKILTLRDSSVISDGATNTNNGVVVTTSGSNTMVVGQNLNFSGFTNSAGSGSTAFRVTSQGTQGELTGVFKNNSFDTNYKGLIGTLETTNSGSLSIQDTGSTYTATQFPIHVDSLAAATQGNYTLTITQATITSSIPGTQGITFNPKNTGAGGITSDVTIDGLNSSLSNATNSFAINYNLAARLTPSSTHTLTIKNSHITGDGVTQNAVGIDINLNPTTGTGSFIGNFTNNTFQGNLQQGADQEGVDINYSDPIANGITTTLNLENNTFNSPATLQQNMSSVRIDKIQSATNSPVTVNMHNNTMLGSGSGNGLMLGTNPAVTSPNSLVVNSTGTAISGYPMGLIFHSRNAPDIAAPGIYVLNLLSGNVIKGNTFGVYRFTGIPPTFVSGDHQDYITVNGINALAAVLNADVPLQAQVFGNTGANFADDRL